MLSGIAHRQRHCVHSIGNNNLPITSCAAGPQQRETVVKIIDAVRGMAETPDGDISFSWPIPAVRQVVAAIGEDSAIIRQITVGNRDDGGLEVDLGGKTAQKPALF